MWIKPLQLAFCQPGIPRLGPLRRLQTCLSSTPPGHVGDMKVYSSAGMDVDEFFSKSLGTWRSMRSSHSLATQFVEEVNSEIVIESIALDHPEVYTICELYDVDPSTASVAVKTAWEGSSDWDDEEISGETVLVVLKDDPMRGQLLRSQGYAETIPARGTWAMEPNGTFVLYTPYNRASAEERIWFATPNLRIRVSFIRTATGNGVLTASMSSELRLSS